MNKNILKAEKPNPVVEFDEEGKPATISYNLPEPSSLNGRTFFELTFGDEEVFKIPSSFISVSNNYTSSKIESQYSLNLVKDSMINGFNNITIFPYLKNFSGLIRLIEIDGDKYRIISNLPISEELANLHPIDVYAALTRGKNLVVFKSKQGLLTFEFVNSYGQTANQNFFLFSNNNTISSQINKKNKILKDKSFRRIVIIDGDVGMREPQDGQIIGGKKPEGIKITVKGTVSWRLKYVDGEDKGSQRPDRIWITFNGQEYMPTIDQDPIGQYSKYEKELPSITESGIYTITATAHFPASGDYYEDQPWHKNTVTISLEDPIPADVTPPNIEINSPANNTSFTTTTNETTLKLEGTSSDLQSGVASVLVNIGDGYLPATPFANNDWSHWSFQGITSKQGQLQLTARATDKSGNAKEVSISITIKQEVPKPKKLRIYLVESYRLSSYLGQYGAGKIIKTFSLLPGEKTKISIKTYSKTKEEAKQSSSILDSVTDESTKDFENTLALEQSDKENYQETFSYEINARAEANWGWGKADVSGGVKGGTNSARETFVKNIMNTTQKHASKASSKRDVTVNTSYEKTTEQGEETSIEREIQNINVGRTLNFVFRQMNQEIITILHLIDARIIVWDGDPNPDTSIHKEYSMPELDSLFEEFIKDDKIDMVRDAIKAQLKYIFNYKGEAITDFLTTETLPPDKTYLRIPKRTTHFEVEETGTELLIPGIVIAFDNNVMRTDGILVEALLGKSNALDDYSIGLQNSSVKSKEVDNEIKLAEKEKSILAMDIVKAKDKIQADLYQRLLVCCKSKIFSLWPTKENEANIEK